VNHWVNTVSLEHVRTGVEGGFTQADHGRALNLRRLSKGDLLVFYSPRTGFRSGETLQSFTAIARVIDEEPYQVEMTPRFRPWRRRIEAVPCEPAPIRSLIDELGFITDKARWGLLFRRGLFEIPAADFGRIARAMGADIR
jgi:hypothetical protein